MASRKTVKKFIFSNCFVDPYAPGEVLEGFDPDRAEVSGDAYFSKRALALFKKVGTTPKDEEMVLGVLADGRWALIGPQVEGHSFVVEALGPR